MDLDTLYEYREIRRSDYHAIKALHEEFFPVRYLDQFYEDVVEGKGIGGDDLCTIVVTTKAREYKGSSTGSSSSGSSSSSSSSNSRSNSIGIGNEGGGCIISSPSTTTIQRNMSNGEDDYTDKTHTNHEVIIGFLLGQFMNTDVCDEKFVFDVGNRPKKMFYILTLGVRKEYRNIGLASHLVNKSIEVAKQDHTCGIVYLHVIHYNKAAIRMYEKNDFEFMKTLHNFYTIDNEFYDSYLYGMFLNGYDGEFMMKLTNILRKNTLSFFAAIMVVFNGLCKNIQNLPG